MPRKDSVSVVICSHALDRVRDTLEAVASVTAQTVHHPEIVVAVDNCPPLADTLRLLLPPSAKLVHSDEGRGVSATRNAGIRASSMDKIAFLDDDAAAEYDWLERLLEPFSDERVVGVGGKVVPAWVGGRPSWMPEELFWVVGCTFRGFAHNRGPVRNVHGANMCFRRSALEAAGLFLTSVGYRPGRLLSGDDTQICMKIANVMPGCKIVYEPKAVVRHKVPPNRQTIRYLLRRAYGEGAGKAIIEAAYSGHALLDEQRYLRHLTQVYLPRSLRAIIQGPERSRHLRRLGATGLAAVATGLGYVLTRFRVRRGAHSPL